MSDPGSNTLRNWAAELETLDEQIEGLQTAKREFYAAIREEHGKVTADALKAAMKIRRMDGEKRAKADEVDAETARILSILESEPRAARATRVENIEEFPDQPQAGGSDEEARHVVENRRLDTSSEIKGTEPQPSRNANDDALGESAAEEISPPDFQPPAFLVKSEGYSLRPHCLRPDNCGGYGTKHCGSCERAAKAAEAA